MNSLRWRLVLGFAFVALVPLALAILLFVSRIQDSVRTEAANRLNETLRITRARMLDDAGRLHGRLNLLATDAGLRRAGVAALPGDTALVRGLSTRRNLLGLDVLEWIGPGALVLAAAGDGLADSAGVGGDVVGLERRATPVSGSFIERDADGVTWWWIARAPIVDQGMTHGVLRGGVRLDGAWLTRQRGSTDIELALRGRDGSTIATTLGPGLEAYLPLLEDPEGAGLEKSGYLVRRVLIEQNRDGSAELIGLASTSGSDAAVRGLWMTGGVLGALGLLVALTLGLFWSRRIAAPLERLAGFSARVAQGEWDQPLEVRSFDELEALARALDRMRTDLQRYRARLVASERQAAWGQMARMVAHEVKNPLTPIAVSVADLKRSYEEQRPEFARILAEAVRTIGEEIAALKHLLQEFSEFGRMPEPVFESFPIAEMLADLRTLYATEVAAGRLSIATDESNAHLDADRAQLRQAIINLIKNGLEATAAGGGVRVMSELRPDECVFVVADGGPGLDADRKEKLFVPEYTTKQDGSGLGLAIVERIVTAHGGTISVTSDVTDGTRFEIRLARHVEEV